MHSSKYCIIGAGPSGLACARAFQIKGLEYDQFDAHSDVGGLWDIDQPGTAMYESAHFISSKTMSGFEGFPMPAHYPDYPSHRKILEYIHSFAHTWALRDRISFGVRVEGIEKLENGQWSVALEGGETRRYAGIVCATGANWHPRMPAFPGQFCGEIRHASTYRNGDEFRGKRVLIVGAGNSGVDIACDAAINASRAFLSVRRGYHFIPKHIFGIPTDVIIGNGPKMPLFLQRAVLKVLLRMSIGDVTRLGFPKPDHNLLESHPILNSQVLHYLQHGDLAVRPNIDHFDGEDVVFSDGTREAIDTVILATGYNQVQPYAHDYFKYDGGRPNMYLQLFSREHDGLVAPSFIETNSGAFKLFDIMAFAIANAFKDRQGDVPSSKTLTDLIAHDHPDLTGGIAFVKSERHSSYFDSYAWQAHLKKLFRKLGWKAHEVEIAETLPPNPVKTPMSMMAAE